MVVSPKLATTAKLPAEDGAHDVALVAHHTIDGIDTAFNPRSSPLQLPLEVGEWIA